MNIPNEEQDVINNSAHNPFPEPQTIPAGWDLSEIIPTSQTDSNVDEVDFAKSEND